MELEAMNPFTWYNIAYFGFMFLGLMYLAVLTLTGGAHADSDVEAHVDHDLNHDVDHHIDHDHDTDHNHDVSHENAGVMDILNLRNRCPKVYAFTFLFLIWGIFGYIWNLNFLTNFIVTQIVSYFIGLVLSLFIAVMVIRRIAPFIARYMPSDKSFDGQSGRGANYVGRRAKVSTMLAANKVGAVILSGSTVKLYARLVNYDGEPLRRDTEVLIVDFKDNEYQCTLISKELTNI